MTAGAFLGLIARGYFSHGVVGRCAAMLGVGFDAIRPIPQPNKPTTSPQNSKTNRSRQNRAGRPDCIPGMHVRNSTI
jgi:hypothetical protein